MMMDWNSDTDSEPDSNTHYEVMRLIGKLYAPSIADIVLKPGQ